MLIRKAHKIQLGDEDDEDDPFAQLEEGFDEMGKFDISMAVIELVNN